MQRFLLRGRPLIKSKTDELTFASAIPFGDSDCRKEMRGKPWRVPSRVGPVDKSKNSAETRSGPGRIINLETEKDGIYHPLKI